MAIRLPTHLFRRVTSGGAVMAELDGLRAVAILPVVLFHATLSIYLKGAEGQVSAITGDAEVFRSPIGWIVAHGFLGVQLFFAISGFVVVLPFARARLLGERPPSLSRFYLKRLTRIEPPYVIALAAFFVGTLAVAPQNAHWQDYLAGLFYLRRALFGDEPWAFFISWSLEIEVQFYLLAPFIAAVFWVRSHALRRAILLAAIAVGALFAANARLAGVEPAPLGRPLQHGAWLGSEIAFFLVGVLVADLWTLGELRTGTRVSSLSWDAAWLAGLAAVVASYRALEATPWGIVPLVAGIFALTLGAFRSRAVKAVLSVPIVSIVGGACYTIYLFHFLCVSLFGRFLAPFTTTAFERNLLLVALPFALAVTLACLCLFPLVERPFMRGDWPGLVLRAIRERRLAPLAPLFSR
jgi:peptidoglycan/LPS O-acetylase OafA/YrhL